MLRNTGRTAHRSLDRGHSGELQGREFIAPQFDEQVQVNWLASYTGDTTAAYVRRYSFMEDSVMQALIPPLPTDPILRPPIAGAVDGDGYLYLASGFVDPGEPCNAPRSCIAAPGCSELQPCELRRATVLTFGRPLRRGAEAVTAPGELLGRPDRDPLLVVRPDEEVVGMQPLEAGAAIDASGAAET